MSYHLERHFRYGYGQGVVQPSVRESRARWNHTHIDQGIHARRRFSDTLPILVANTFDRQHLEIASGFCAKKDE